MGDKVQFTDLDEKRASLFVGLRKEIPPKNLDDTQLSNAIKQVTDPKLLVNLLNELSKRVAGENYAKTAIFLCACGIWVKNPLQKTHCIINSSSSAGKDFIVKAVFDLFPAFLKDYRSKITPEAFSYWRTDKASRDAGFTWDGRLLYLEDCSQSLLDSPTFRIMLSGGSFATIVRDQRAIDLQISGRPLVLVTTATTKPSNELLNRFIPISLDESSEQTTNVFFKELDSVNGQKQEYDEQFQHCLSLLGVVRVKIPFTAQLSGLFPCKPVSMRREFARFLTLIQNSAALHQYQRERSEAGEVLATWDDYDAAVFAYGGFERDPVKLTMAQQQVFGVLKENDWLFKLEVATLVGKDDTWVYRLLMQLVERGLVGVRMDDSEAKTKAKQKFAKVSSLSQLPKSWEIKSVLTDDDKKIAILDNLATTNTATRSTGNEGKGV